MIARSIQSGPMDERPQRHVAIRGGGAQLFHFLIGERDVESRHAPHGTGFGTEFSTAIQASSGRTRPVKRRLHRERSRAARTSVLVGQSLCEHPSPTPGGFMRKDASPRMAFASAGA